MLHSYHITLMLGAQAFFSNGIIALFTSIEEH